MCDLNCVNLIDLSLEDSCSNIGIKTENDSLLGSDSSHIPSSWCKGDSLENNPFDRVQKLVDKLDDPFDIVERKANLKAQQTCTESVEVKLGNLLSLSDDNLPDQEKIAATSYATLSDLRTLDLESPPIVFNDSTSRSSSETSNSTKLRTSLEHRKRLLKLSLSNSAYSSPTFRKQSSGFEDVLDTPVSSMFSRAAEFGELSLAAESPLKLVQDEDLISEEALNLVDSEKNFEADLELLNIPMLNSLPSTALDQIRKSAEDAHELTNANILFENSSPNLKAAKPKLDANTDEIRTDQHLEISSLIHNLKMLISKVEMVDDKKRKASELLGSLSSSLKACNTAEINISRKVDTPPQSIKREGTFDMDLKEKTETNADNTGLIQAMPTCMVSSSATYDSETSNDKQDFNLPEIAPLSPRATPTPSCYQNLNVKDFQTNVNDIMEQLSNILINISGDNQTTCSKPTLIFVMNTSQLNSPNSDSNQNAAEINVRSASCLENSCDESSPDLTKVNEVTRRRSQSLSIHDKVKVVHLGLPTQGCSILKSHYAKLDESSPKITTTPPNEKQMPELKKPAQMRRNSYSSGTPYTAKVGLSRTRYGTDYKHPMKIHTTQAMDAHHGSEKQTVVRPMSMPSNNFPTFKPDLKKKSKYTTESIMKSCGPLKATVPANMLKISPPTPGKNNKSKRSLPITPLRAKISSTLSGVGFPKACSTPAASPLNNITRSVNKPRYSCTSSTNSSRTSSAISATLKRRTITEFTSKSTLKPRGPSPSLAATASPSKSSAERSKLSISVGARVSKTPLKSPSLNTSTVKTTSLLSSRSSVGGSLLSARNKENRRP